MLQKFDNKTGIIAQFFFGTVMQTGYIAKPTSRRPSWRGVLAGLVMGVVVLMAMMALALVLGSFLSLDLRGAGITAGVYAIITALISAFVAGHFAVKCSAPEAILGDGTDISPKDAALTGMLTAATIVLTSTLFTMNTATGIMSSAGNVATSVVGGAASAVGGAASAVGSVAATGAAGASAAAQASNIDISQSAQNAYNKITGTLSREDIEAILAKNSDLTQAQISAGANVIEDLLANTKSQIQSMDFTSLDTWRNLDSYAKARVGEIENILKGDELVRRLQAEGLNEAQAQGVREAAIAKYSEYKAQADQAIAETRMRADEFSNQAQEAARKAALYTGLFWLISTLLTFVAAVMGAKSAAANYRRA